MRLERGEIEWEENGGEDNERGRQVLSGSSNVPELCGPRTG